MTESLPSTIKRIYKRLRLRELSLVDDPCVPGSDVLVVKAKNPLSPDGPESTDKDRREVGDGQPGGGQASENEQVDKALAPFHDLIVQLDASSLSIPDFLAQSAIVAGDVRQQAETGGDPVAKSAAHAALAVITETTVNLEQLNAAYAALQTRVTAAEGEVTVQKARADTAEAALATATAEVAKAKATPLSAEEQEAEVIKTMPEAMRKIVEDAKASKKETDAKAEEAAVEGEVTKARTLGVAEPDAVGKALHVLRKADSAATDIVEKALKASLAVSKAGEDIFKAYGAVATAEGDLTPEAELAQKAAEIQKAKPTLTKEQAHAEAAQTNPKLYDAMVAKRRVGAHLAAQ